ncbi:MAG: hypothetical protein GPJ54_10515 [Candidatus Heimdallarchaeota archaeon]|nr:hypothetical protein [Candidatus Heimdallarchaeota archaeon]
MRKKAEKKLADKGNIVEKVDRNIQEAPSMVRGFLFIFLGTLATIIFISNGQFLIGIFVGAPFILIGSYRINRATMINSQRTEQSIDFSGDSDEAVK